MAMRFAGSFIFQSTLSMRRATAAEILGLRTEQFQSTLSMRRATYAQAQVGTQYASISIHALHEESDSCSLYLKTA